MNGKLVKVIGIAASAVGVLATITTSWVNEQNLANQIAEKVAEAVSNVTNKD